MASTSMATSSDSWQILDRYREATGWYAPYLAGAAAVFGMRYGAQYLPAIARRREGIVAAGAAAGYVVSAQLDSTEGAMKGAGGAALVLVLT